MGPPQFSGCLERMHPVNHHMLPTAPEDAAAGSQFEAIMRRREDGTESWSGRDLMRLMGYSSWQKFETPLSRAISTARNEGRNVDDLFTRSVEKGLGRPREDVDMVRYAAYLVAMNGDPNMPEVAAAQSYFAIRTREAETAQRRELTPDEIVAQALQITSARVAHLEAERRVLEPKAEFADTFLTAEGDYDTRDAAQILRRDHGITHIGQNRLRDWMQSHRWIDKRRRPYQDKIDAGYLRLKPRTFKFKRTNGEQQLADPQLRITPNGVAALARALTKTQPQLEVGK